MRPTTMSFYTLEEVLEREPTLGRVGFGVPRGVPHAQRDETLAASRQALRDQAARVEAIGQWIDTYLTPLRTINRGWSSAYLTELAAHDLGRVANGEVIVAMVMVVTNIQNIVGRARAGLQQDWRIVQTPMKRPRPRGMSRPPMKTPRVMIIPCGGARRRKEPVDVRHDQEDVT
jgi:hypothetical protein